MNLKKYYNYIKSGNFFSLSKYLTFSLKIKKLIGTDINFQKNVKSETKIDVVIPAIDKDYDTLVFVVDSLRKNIKNPISTIHIVSPLNSTKIKDLCRKKGCKFVDENTVVPITKRDIVFNPKDKYFPNGLDRSSWIFQQLLKWGMDKICKEDHILIADSDTIFIRPQIFTFDEKIIMSCSADPCHIPYYRAYEKLLGEKARPLYNFTSHHTLFDKKLLGELKEKIEENTGDIWYKAIIHNLDQNETSCVSDYETYGQFLFHHYRENIILENWYNLSLNRNDLKNIKKLEKEKSNRFKTISFHSYNK